MSMTRVKSNFLTVVLLLAAAVVIMLGFSSTQAFAADNETSVPAEEVVLYSEQTVPVAQEVTQADYDKMETQYNIHPDGTPVIESKTQETETVVTKTANGGTRTTKTTTTGWVVRDTAPSISSSPETTQTTLTTPAENTTSENSLNPAVLALAAPVVIAAAPVIAIAAPAIIAVAVPVAIASSLLNTSSPETNSNGSANSSSVVTTSNNTSSQSTPNSVGSLSGLGLLG